MSLKFKKKGRSGFTLIELLVVIAIIGLLSSVVLSSLNTARAKARDAQRIASLKQMNLALQMYYDANGSYPNYFGSSGNPLWSEGGTLALALKPYLSKLPIDPINSGGYYYAYWRLPQGAWGPGLDCNNKYILFAGQLETSSVNHAECGGVTSLTFVVGE
jgi:prepilin-type N-terminal cleavage/methylation domain-containing protein